MIMRVVCDARTAETRQSLEAMDFTYLLKVNEYLDIQDYIEEVSTNTDRKSYNHISGG